MKFEKCYVCNKQTNFETPKECKVIVVCHNCDIPNFISQPERSKREDIGIIDDCVCPHISDENCWNLPD